MLNLSRKNYRQGFTLIELLVVMSIISLLSATVLRAVRTTRARADDATRVSNVREIQKAIYIAYPYFQTTTPLPQCTDPGYAGGCEATLLPDGSTGYSDSSRDGTFMEFLRPYIGKIGQEPSALGPNYYIYGSGRWPPVTGPFYKYVVGVALDSSSSPALKGGLNFGVPAYDNFYFVGEQ